jgi:hypothetical protein
MRGNWKPVESTAFRVFFVPRVCSSPKAGTAGGIQHSTSLSRFSDESSARYTICSTRLVNGNGQRARKAAIFSLPDMSNTRNDARRFYSFQKMDKLPNKRKANTIKEHEG